jgi:arabinose-5-phosphate isomerase
MDFAEISRSVFEQEIAALAKVNTQIGSEMNALVELIYESPGKVVVTGIGKTGHIGQKIAASLASTGTPQFL